MTSRQQFQRRLTVMTSRQQFQRRLTVMRVWVQLVLPVLSVRVVWEGGGAPFAQGPRRMGVQLIPSRLELAGRVPVVPVVQVQVQVLHLLHMARD